MIKQKLKNILPRDYFFYTANPEREKDFVYKKKNGDDITKKKSALNQPDSGYEDSSFGEIKNIAASRGGRLFINSLVISGLLTVVPVTACAVLNFHWSAYAACTVIYISAVYLVFNFLNITSYMVYLNYRIEGGKRVFYDSLLDSLYELSGAEYVWHISRIYPNKKTGSHGGAAEIYDRHTAAVKKQHPAFIRANLDIWSVRLKSEVLYFFPDFILLERERRFSFFEYESLSIEYLEKPYIETGKDPSDCEKIGKTWLHPKKDGSADRRFSNNPQISVMLYAEIKISVPDGGHFHFQVSNRKAAYIFYKFISLYSRKSSEEKYRKPEQPGRKGKEQKTYQEGESGNRHRRSDVKLTPEEETEKAYLTLGLKPGAAPDELRAAYYHMAKKHHPDLAAGNRGQADSGEKMKEINRAYERLKDK